MQRLAYMPARMTFCDAPLPELKYQVVHFGLIELVWAYDHGLANVDEPFVLRQPIGAGI